MESSHGPTGGGTALPLQNIFGSVSSNSSSALGASGGTPGAVNVQSLFAFGAGGNGGATYGTSAPSGNFGVEGVTGAGGAKAQFGAANMFGGGYGSAMGGSGAANGAPKTPMELFNTSALPSASNVAQSHLSSVPVMGPMNSGLNALSASGQIAAAGMPSLPPMASNLQGLSSSSATPPNNVRMPGVNPSELKARLLALSPTTTPSDTPMLTLRRPVELPESEYRRDSMSADKTNCAYVTNLKNVGAAIRVWRDTSGAQSFTKNPPISLKEYIGNPTDIHLTSTSNDDTYVAVGDTTGNVSIHAITSQTFKSVTSSPSSSSADTKYLVLRIVPPAGSPPVQVLRVTWHSMLPQMLAISYSDGYVSVWNIGHILNAFNTNAPLPASELVVNSSYPLTYQRSFQSIPPVVLSLSHGSDTVTDVVMWGGTVFSSAASGTIYMHDLNTGHVQRFFNAHQHGVGAIVLATCPSVESGYMPLFATTSGDGSEIKLWRHASPLADWVCLQSLSLPVESTPYILSRYVFDGIFFLFNPVVGSAWELKLFVDEMALLPGNYFNNMKCNYSLMLAPYEIILKYTKEGIAIMAFPKTSYSKENLKYDPSAQPLAATLPTYAATVPNQSQPSTPTRNIEYQLHNRESSFSANPLGSLLQTVAPPSRNAHQADPLPVLPPRPASQSQTDNVSPATHSALQRAFAIPSNGTNASNGAERVFSSNPSTTYNVSTTTTLANASATGTTATLPVPTDMYARGPNASSQMGGNAMNVAPSGPAAIPTNLPLPTASTISAVQAILDEASRNLGDMVAAEQERWRAEDKNFMLRVNEEMRNIPTAIADRLDSEFKQLPTVAVDVPDLARNLAVAMSNPIGLAFREQFGDVLVPGLEDATAKMLKAVDEKMKGVATQHAQTIATNDVARSVEPLVASLMQATAEMTKSLNSIKPQAHNTTSTGTAVLPPQAESSAKNTTNQAILPISAATQASITSANGGSTPQKPRSRSGSSGAPAANTPAKTKNPAPAAEGKTKQPKTKTPSTKETKKENVSVSSAPTPSTSASPSASNHPVEYWFFALAHGIHL